MIFNRSNLTSITAISCTLYFIINLFFVISEKESVSNAFLYFFSFSGWLVACVLSWSLVFADKTVAIMKKRIEILNDINEIK